MFSSEGPLLDSSNKPSTSTPFGVTLNHSLPNHTSSLHFQSLNSSNANHNGQTFKALQPKRSIIFFIKVVFYISLLIFFLNMLLYFFSSVAERQDFERDISSSFEHLDQHHHSQFQESINKELSDSKEKLSLLRKNTIQPTTALSKIKGVFFGGLKSGSSKTAYPLLSRYNPPKVPSIMETFTSDKRLTSVSESDKSQPLISISKGPEKSEPGFYIDKENEIKARIDVSTIPKSTLSAISYMFESKDNCIRNDVDMDSVKKTDVQFTTCRFENICLNRKGEWIIYTNKPLETNERPWVFTSSVYNEEFSPAKFKLKIAPPPKSVLYKGSENLTPEKIHPTTITLAKNFKWVSTPTFGFFRHNAEEVGSLVMNNYLPMFNQMADYEFVNYDNNILFLDDVHNDGTGKFSRAQLDKASMAEDLSIDFGSFVSSSLPLQVCDNDEKGSYVDFAPCRQLRNAQSKPLDKEGEELDTCFSSLVVGSPDSYFLSPEKRHHLIPVFRDYVLNGMGYVPPRSYFEGRKKILIIGILNSSKKESIVNADKLTDYLSGLAKDILQQVNSHRIPDDRYESIRILNLKLDDMTVVQQIRLFTVMDVFITNQGLDSYYSLFMYNPRALVIYAPMCFTATNQCTDYNLRVLHTFSNIKVVSLMEYLSLVECVKEPTDSAKGSLVTAMKEVPKNLTGDCHIRINASGLYLLIIKAVKHI